MSETTEGKNAPQQTGKTQAQEQQEPVQQEPVQQEPVQQESPQEQPEQVARIPARDWSKAREILEKEGPTSRIGGQSEGLHPLAKRIQEFVAQGRTKEEVSNFLRLQSMDMSEMGYEQAIKARMKMESPGLTDQDVETLLEEKYGVLDPSDSDYESKKRRFVAKMKMEGNEAKNWLKDKMAPLNDPEAQQRAEEQKKARERTRKAWSTVTGDLIKNFKVQHNHAGKGLGGGEYSFEYEPKLSPTENEQLKNAMVNYAMQQGLDFDDKSLPELTQFRDTMVWTMKSKEIMNAALEDMFASVTSYYLKNRAPGMPRNASRQGSRSEAAPKRNRASTVDRKKGKFI